MAHLPTRSLLPVFLPFFLSPWKRGRSLPGHTGMHYRACRIVNDLYRRYPGTPHHSGNTECPVRAKLYVLLLAFMLMSVIILVGCIVSVVFIPVAIRAPMRHHVVDHHPQHLRPHLPHLLQGLHQCARPRLPRSHHQQHPVHRRC